MGGARVPRDSSRRSDFVISETQIFPEINSNSTLAGSGALFGFQSGRPFGDFGKVTVFTRDFHVRPNRGVAQGGPDAALRPDRRSCISASPPAKVIHFCFRANSPSTTPRTMGLGQRRGHFFQTVVTILRCNVNKQARPPRLATTRSTATTATQQRRLLRSVVVAVRGRGDPRDLGGAGKQT
jgi:hypothetical protein